MDQPYLYEIRVEGQLSNRWTNWFAGLEIDNDVDGITTLRGPLVDQAALFGLLSKVQALNLSLVSVNRLSP